MSCLHRPFASALYCINIWYPYDILLCDLIGPTEERRKKCTACTVHELPAWTLCLCIILHKHMISIWYSVMGYDRSNNILLERGKKCKACTVHELPAWTLCLCIILHKHMISIWYSVMGYDRSNRRKKEKM